MKKISICLLLSTCVVSAVITTSREAAIVRRFEAQRDTSLRSPDGWLALVGLFWLTPDRAYTLGSGHQSDFQLPPGSAPELLGKVRLSGNRVSFENLAGAAVTLGGKPVGGSIVLPAAEDDKSTVRVGTVSFYLIERGGKFGLRVRDSNSPTLKSFKGLTYFPPNPALHFAQARFIKDRKKIPILNVLGQTDLEESPGVVEIPWQGKTYRLRPITEGDTLFFLFKDSTNKTDTYQPGRMLNTPMPRGDTVDVDFNLSYNPPCAFTVYATCPLAPKENTLPFPVEAGEKRYGHGHS